MSTHGEFGRLLSLFPPEEPQSFNVTYHGLEYRGEVIVADKWNVAWGRPLDGDGYFRIVLLQRRQRVPLESIQDSRIAVCVPGSGLARPRSSLAKDLATVRETRSVYSTGRDLSARTIETYLSSQEEKLQDQLASEEAIRYASGSICTPSDLGKSAKEIFTGTEPTVWLEDVASRMLSWAYPDLPLSPRMLPGVVAEEDVERIYSGMFSNTTEGRVVFGEYGPGLGLSKVQSPSTFDPAECRVFQLIRTELEQDHGELPWARIHHMLAHATGITQPLATLYLLAFVHYGNPEVELVLTPEHSLTFVSKRPVRGYTIGREFIPLLPWQKDSLVHKANLLRIPHQEVSWNRALQYTSLLCQGLSEVEEGSSGAPDQEQALLVAMENLEADIREALGIVDTLSTAIASSNNDQVSSSLSKLLGICEAKEFQRVYELTRDTYNDPRELLHALELLNGLLDLGHYQGEIVALAGYLDALVIESGYRQLSFDRTILLQEISVQSLLEGGQRWSALNANIRDFQARFRQAYVAHHAHYQQDVHELRGPLNDARLKLDALVLLNSIEELGGSLGVELESVGQKLELNIKVCSSQQQDIHLDALPYCDGCRMALGELLPSVELRSFFEDLDRALAEQNRRLSRRLVDRIVLGKVDQRLEDFLKIIQASDLSALSNTLDKEMAGFIRRILNVR